MSLPPGFVLDQEPKTGLPEGFVLDSPVQNLNKTSAPKEDWRANLPQLETPHLSMLDRFQNTWLGRKLLGPVVQPPMGGIQGALPQAYQLMFGGVSQPSAKQAGLLNINPAMALDKEALPGKAVVGYKLLEQVNPMNVALGGGMKTLWSVAEPTLQQQLAKAAIASTFAKQGIEGGMEAAGRMSVSGPPPVSIGQFKQNPKTGQFELYYPQGTTEQWENASDLLLNALMVLGSAHAGHAPPPMVPREGIRPTETRFTPEDLDALEGRIPQERRLPAPPTKVQMAQQAFENRQPQAPTRPSFVFGPQGIAPVGPGVGAFYDVGQARAVKLLGAPPIESGPTTLPQTLLDVGKQLEETPLSPSGIGKSLGLIHKQWPAEIPVVGGLSSYTDPKTGLTVEGISPTASMGEVKARMEAKLKEEQNAIPELRTDKLSQTQPPGNIQKVGEEVRKGATEQGTAQEERYAGAPLPKLWEEGKDFVHEAVKVLGRHFQKADQRVGREQMLGTIRNKLGAESSEWKMWKDLGIEQAKAGTPEELAKWMEEKGPRVEVWKFVTASSEMSKKEQERVRLVHELDTLQPNYREYWQNGSPPSPSWSKEVTEKYNRLNELQRDVEAFEERHGTMNATHWQSVAPKAEKDMPGYVEIAVVRSKNKPYTTESVAKDFEPDKFPSSHNFPPNTLGFVRGYMEVNPKTGEKTFHVIEVQSDWAQEFRESQAEKKIRQEQGAKPEDVQYFEDRTKNDPLLQHYERLALKAAIDHAREQGATKVAIQDAESAMMTEGHDVGVRRGQVIKREQIPNLDVDEWKAKRAELKKEFPENKYEVQVSWNRPNGGEVRIVDTSKFEDISQEPGMRLHYDQTLPKIASELTGDKGERVSFGEHKMAFEEKRGQTYDIQTANSRLVIDALNNGAELYQLGPKGPKKVYLTKNSEILKELSIKEVNKLQELGVLEYTKDSGLHGDTAWQLAEKYRDIRQPRKDLIFKNEQGQPKTDVSARVYDISKFSEKRATGEPMSIMGKRYAGIPMFDPDMWKSGKKAIDELREKVALSLNIGNKDKPSPDVVAPLKALTSDPAREKRILNNPKANPFVKQAKAFAQPGEVAAVSEKIRNAFVPFLNAAAKTDRLLMPWDVIFDWLDGGKAGFRGPLTQEIRVPFDEKFNLESNMSDALTAPLKDIVKKNKLGPKEEQRIGVFLHAQQEGGIQRMLESGVKQETINNIVKNLTPAEKEYVDAWRKLDDTLYPEIARVAKEADKVDLKRVANHFPWMRDFEKYEPEVDPVATNPKLKSSNATASDALWPGLPLELGPRKTPGTLESRVPNAKTPIRFDAFAMADRYIKDATHYISSRQLVKDTAKIVSSDKFRETYGDVGQQLMMDFLNTYARQGRYKNNRWIDAIKRNLGRSIIGARIPSQFVHMANIPLAQKQAGLLWWKKGLDEALTSEGRDFLRQNFKETFMRGGGEPVQAEISAQIARTLPGKVFNNVSRWSFAVMRYIDMLNSQATVLGVYMRLLKEKGLDPTKYKELPLDRELLGEARIRARRAVASPIYKDVPPALTRGGSLSRAFFQFQNVFLDQYSNLRYEGAKVGIAESLRGHPKELMLTLGALVAMLMVETSIKYGYKEGIKELAGTKKKDEEDEFTKELLNEALKRAPGAGQLQSSLTYGGVGVPVIDVPLSIAREAKKARDEEGGAKTIAATRAIGNALELTGIPGISQALDITTALERRKLFKTHEKRLQEQTGKDVQNMTLRERVRAEHDYRQAQPPMSEAEKAKSAERAIANQAKRGEELAKGLDKGTRVWLESRGLVLPGYDNKLRLGGQLVYLTEDETTRLGELVNQQYTNTISRIRQNPRFDRLSNQQRQTVFSDAMSAARQRARGLMTREINEKSRSKIEQH